MDKGKVAAAVAYEPSAVAPIVTVSGRGGEAERIVALAKEAGIAVVEEPALAALLEAVRPGDYLPEWCWEAAAKVLAFVAEQAQKN
jgi:flagellar biosynthesis protein